MRPETVTLPLCSRTNASPFWIMLLLVLGRPDNGMIRVILDRRRSDVLPCRNATRPAPPRNRVDVRIGRSWHVRMPVPFASRLETGSSVQSTFRSGMTSFLCHDHHAEIAGGWSCYDPDGGILRQSGPASGARSRRVRPRILETALRGNALLRVPAARSWRRASRRIGGGSPAVNSSRNRSTHGEAATRSAHAPSNTACCHGTSAGFATGR